MTKKELEKAQKPKQVEKLLDEVGDKLTTDYQKTAYNFLIDYLEIPGSFQGHEGGRLLILCLEILHTLKKKKKKAKRKT